VGEEKPQLAPPVFAIVYLPCGLFAGFRLVTLSYLLAAHGVSVAKIAEVGALALLPTTWQFLFGPIIDVSLDPRRWHLIAVLTVALSLVLFAFTPLTPAALPAIAALSFAGGLASTLTWAAAGAVMAHTTPERARGAAAGWAHLGGSVVACLSLAALSALSSAPVLATRLRKADAEGVVTRAGAVVAALWRFVLTRRGVITLFVLLLPLDLGAATNMLPAVAWRWRASADVVALVSGALGGCAFIPGCVLGGYLSTRFPLRPLYMALSVAFAAGEAAMTLAPHTPAAFAAFVLLNNLLLGAANGAYTAVIFDCLGAQAAATLGSILFSLGQVPLLTMTLAVGGAETRWGPDAMLDLEAGAAVVALAAYAVLAAAWPARQATPTLAPVA
jgi:PAT family beta-lactamase induction signal transducer AmpG